MPLLGMSRAAGGSTPRGKKDEPEEPPEQLGKIEFSLDYQFDKNQLTINIVQCTELKAMDISGTSDPYVKVFILPEKKKKFATKVHKKTLNPVFNENFTFPKLPFTEVPSKTLILQIFDHDAVGADDQIGEVQVPLGSVDLAEITKFNREIKEPPKDVLGDICFSLRYVPQKKQLTMNIMECKNLKKMDLGGLSDPYVKINLMQNNKRVKKSKTSIKMHTLNPYYNESFKFEVAPEMIQRTQVVVMVMDYDRVGSNEPIGQVILGLGSGGTAQKHWCDMIAAPRRSIAQWHSLVPVEDKKDD